MKTIPEPTGLIAFIQVRQAIGDTTCRLMQDEVVARVKRIVAQREEAMRVLRQIASMPRRTREQRLANSAVTFLDAMEREARK